MTDYTLTFEQYINSRSLSSEDLKKVNPKDIDFRYLSKNLEINYTHIALFPDADWDFDFLSYEIYFKWPDDLIRKFIHKMNHNALSKSEYFNLQWIDWYPEGNWDLTHISFLLTELEDALQYRHLDLDFQSLSTKYINLNMEWFKTFPNANWDFKMLSKHKNFNYNWLTFFPDANWDFDVISKQHKCITIETIKQFPNSSWDFKALSKNRNINLNSVVQFPNKMWYFPNVTANSKNIHLSLLNLLNIQANMNNIFCEIIKNGKLEFPLLAHIKTTKDFHDKYPSIFLFWMSLFSSHNYKYSIKLLPESKKLVFNDMEEIPKLSSEDKSYLFNYLKQGIFFDYYYPQLFTIPQESFSIYDLSGDEYTITNWWDGDIIELFKLTYPDLGDIDIFMGDYYFSQLDRSSQRTLILNKGHELTPILLHKNKNMSDDLEKDYEESRKYNHNNVMLSYTLIYYTMRFT